MAEMFISEVFYYGSWSDPFLNLGGLAVFYLVKTQKRHLKVFPLSIYFELLNLKLVKKFTKWKIFLFLI